MSTFRRILMYTLAAIWLCIWLGCAGLLVHGLLNEERGENLSRVDWLPDEATNVSFLRSYNRTAFEFEINETGYREWVEYPVREIDKPFSIIRHSLAADNRLHRGDVTRPNYPRATIRNGLFYEDRRSNGGGVSTAYDRDAGKAYFCTNPR